MEFILFILGFVLLINASNYFVDSSTKIAKIFHISEIIIGATIVSIGTTLPETLVSATSAFKGLGSMAYGNAIGSIICNTALISALTMVCLPGEINRVSLKNPIRFFFIAYVVYVAIAIFLKRFDRICGFVLIGIFVAYVYSIINNSKNTIKKNEEDIISENKCNNVVKQIVILVVSAIVIAFGSNLLVDNGTIIAIKLGVPNSVVALTMVALGTSLPELMTSITAIIKKHRELSIGNIIGANFLNLVTVTGISAVVRPFDIPAEKMIGNLNASYLIDIPLVLIVMLILCIPPLIKGRTYRLQGAMLLLIYSAYLVFQYVY